MSGIIWTAAQVRSIVKRYKDGEGGQAIADSYGVSLTTILRLLRAEGVRIRKRGRPRTS